MFSGDRDQYLGAVTELGGLTALRTELAKPFTHNKSWGKQWVQILVPK